MKKIFALSLIVAGLTACSTNSNTNSPEVPPVAEVTSIPEWQNGGIQPVSMPNAMNQPTYQPTAAAPQPMSLPPVPSAPAVPQAVTNMSNAYGQTETIGNCQIVRDHHNAPVYSQIQKGCLQEASYTVNKSETLFLIAYLAGKPVSEIANLNNLSAPYQLKPGQVLRLK